MKHYYILFFFCLCTAPLYSQIDYATQVQPIFNNNCIGCHGNNGGVNLTSFEALLNSENTSVDYGDNLIVPGDAEASGLYDKIASDSPSDGGTRMPIGGTLTSEEIATIRQWIDEGANATATSIEDENNIVTEFALNGNYPNPFNPSTQISFTAPVSSRYSIEVFSVSGQRIAEQSGTASIGNNSVPLNLINQPSGMYLYRVMLLSGDRILSSAMGRMTLIK
ncbi:MAG: T9SS type A sorting domain-containing protein [Bacteroidota bacterium]